MNKEETEMLRSNQIPHATLRTERESSNVHEALRFT